MSEYETEKFLSIKNNDEDYGRHFTIKYSNFVALDGLDKGWNYVLNNYEKEISIETLKRINLNVSDVTNQNPGIIREEIISML